MAGIDRALQHLAFVALTGVLFYASPAAAGSAKDCRRYGLEKLRASSPDGYAIYTRVKEPDFFGTWLQCDDAQFDLPTAVHESTHLVTADTDAFPLVGGGQIARPHEVSAFFPPARIAPAFKSDDLVTTYLRPGQASSSTDFLFLLDEFNAYTHDLNAAVDLKEMKRPGQSVDHRDGLSAMMAFVAVYLETARSSQPETWHGLRRPRVAGAIRALWERAERVMARSCGIPDFGTSDKGYIRRFCAADSQSAIAQVLGRAPVCPAACLVPAPDGDQESAEAEDVPAPPRAGGPKENGRTGRPSVVGSAVAQ